MRKSLNEQELMTKVIQFTAECQCHCMRINSHSADESSKLKQLMIQGTSIGTDEYGICEKILLHFTNSDRMPKSIDEVMMSTTFGIKYINSHYEFFIDSNWHSMSTKGCTASETAGKMKSTCMVGGPHRRTDVCIKICVIIDIEWCYRMITDHVLLIR